MGNPPTPGNDDTTYQRLIAKARRLALTLQDRRIITEMEERAQRKAAEMCLDPLPTPSTPPEEFINVLRLRGEEQQHLTVIIDGHHIQLVLNPRGEADPERETELWTWLLERVRQEVQ